MTWDDSDNLPTFHGGHPGKSAYRKMAVESGGVQGIRRVDRFDPDGTQHILNTRAGMPRVITIPAEAVAEPETTLRGYVAHTHTATIAARFSPYSLEVLEPKYKVFQHKYTVMPFATPYNVAKDDETKWFDVVSFFKGAVLINGKAMPALATGGAASDALPWVIKHTDDLPYADAPTNLTEKRVFSVNRVKVHSWANGGLDAVLSGAERRAEGKALLVGARVSQNTAYLSQLSHAGEFWEDGGWVFNSTNVAMLLTPPYLLKTEDLYGVDQSVCQPIMQPVTSGSSVSSVGLPAAEVALIGSGEVHPSAYPDLRVDVWWPWTGVFTYALEGESTVSYSEIVFTNSISNSVVAGGRVIKVDATNEKVFRNNTEHLAATLQTVDLPPNGTQAMGVALDATGTGQDDTFFWTNPETASPTGARGVSSFVMTGDAVPGTGSFRTENQTAAFSIKVGEIVLLDIEFSRVKEIGNHVNPVPITGRYSNYLNNPYGLIGSGEGLGFYSGMIIDGTYTANSNVKDAERASLLAAKASEWASIPLYDHSSYDQGPYYTSTQSNVHSDDHEVTWETRDFILYDEANSVFISVEGHFSGSQSYGDFGHADLTVILKVSTPMGESVMTLIEREFIYAELLEEQETRIGLKLVPSPQLRPIFAPLYQEQGDFRGAAYTTSAEVVAGVEPAYLFNFVFVLESYAAIGGEIPDNAIVSFIPCNLIEMLYAFVFSTKYGVGSIYYPVEYGPRFNDLMTNLFNVQRRVAFRNDGFVDWLDLLGGTYTNETTTELYRV